MQGCYTDKERQEILSGAAEYDRRCEEQLKREAEYAARPFQSDIYRDIEQNEREHLRFLHEDIAALVKVRERFPGRDDIRQFCEYFIRIDQADIEETLEGIRYARQQQVG